MEEKYKLHIMLPHPKYPNLILQCSNMLRFKVIPELSLQHLTTTPRPQLTDKHPDPSRRTSKL